MIDKFFGVFHTLGHWSYLIIFLAAFLESAAFMGFIVPGETIVLLSGFLASQGYLDIGDLLLVIALGAVLGDASGFLVGRRVGKGYFEKHRRLLFLREKHLKKTEDYFRRHGGKTVFFGRFVGFLRAMGPFAAGMSKMPYAKFFSYNVPGGILWAITFTLLGYYFGQSWRLIEKWSGRAGLFVFFIFMVIAGMSYLYRRLSAKQSEIYEWLKREYGAVVSLPLVRGIGERHPWFVSFLRERLSPSGYLGLHLTAGFVVSAVFVWIFGGITEDILTGDPFVEVDRWVLSNILYFRTPAVTEFMVAFTRIAGEVFIIGGSVVLTIYFLLRKRLESLIAFMTAILGGSILVLVLKAVIHRPRPISETSLISAGGWSFPSGHAMLSVIFYGMASYFLIREITSWNFRIFTVISAVFLIFLLGLSRIYLQVHYLSDVLAGYAGGLFWLTVCITALEIYRKKKQQNP